MKKRIGTLLKKIKGNRRSYADRVKKLRLESLESRKLLAADLGINTDPLAHHNSLNPADVNRDSEVSPLDAMLVINHLNSTDDPTLPAVNGGLAKGALLDATADGMITPADALNVINFLNGEGETTPTAVFRHTLTDLDGNPLPEVGGRPTVAIGQLFQLNTSIQDNRNVFTAEGILSAYLDINYDNIDAFDIAGGEIQSLSYFIDQLDLTSSDNTFTLSFDGQTTDPINILQPRDSVAASMQTALEALPNVGAGNVTVVVDAAARSDDEANGILRETYEIRFGRNLLNQDLPLIAIDAAGIDLVAGGTFVRNVSETVPGGSQTGERQSLEFFIDQLDPAAADSSFTLTLEGQTTGPINLTSGGALLSETDMAAAIEAALEGLALVRPEDVVVSLDPSQTDADRYKYFVDFSDRFAGIDVAPMTLDSTNVVLSGAGSFVSTIAEVTPGDSNSARSIVFADIYNIARRGEVSLNSFNDIGATTRPPVGDPAAEKALFTIPMVATAAGTISFMPGEGGNPPSTDILTRMNSEIVEVPVSMVDFGANFVLDVIEDPTAPVAVNDALNTNEDTSLTLNGNILANDRANDASREPLSIVSISTVAGTTVGTLSGNTYTPPADFNGTDILTYIAQDSTGLQSNVGTVTITVDPVNDPPIAVNDAPSVDEDSTNNTLDLLANDSAGPANETEAIVIVALGSTNNGGVATINAGGGSVNYTPAAGFIGTDTFTYTIEDAGGLQSTATVNVDVAPAIVPSARTDTDTTAEGSPIIVDVLDNDRVNTGALATLISAADGANGTVAILDNGTPTDLTDDTVQYTPNADFNGTDTFTYVMNDTAELGVNSTGTVTITVTNVNDPPVLGNDTASGTEDTPVTIPITTLLANDSPGAGEGAGTQNPQTLSITSVAPSSSVEIVGDNVIYTPATDANGTFEFTYTAQDSDVSNPLSATATVTVTIAAVNDDPIAVADSANTDEDNALTIPASDLTSNDSPGPATATDEAGQTLTVTAVSSTSAAGATVSLASGNITYTPVADYNGTDTFTYELSDGEGGTATGTVTVTVDPINDAPIAVSDSITAFKDFPKSIPVSDLLRNDSAGPANESSQTLSIVAVSAAADTNGSVVLNSDGTITYTPTPNYTGPASFTYTLQDSGASGGENVNQTTGTVNITVEEFLPSIIAGNVWVDENDDAGIGGKERGLGGIMVTLTGTSLGQAVPTQTQMTLLDGSYSFDNLGPGSYVVSFIAPTFMPDGHDVAGALGDSDGIDNNNQFAIDLAEPGGFSATGYNFAVEGLQYSTLNEINKLAAPYIVRDTSLAVNGAYFAINNADNSLIWSSKLEGFDTTLFGEAVLHDQELLLTIVDLNQNVFTATLGEGEFVRVPGAGGTSLVRVLGDMSRFTWTQVDLATPPFSATGYLDAIDAIFAQEGW